MLKCSEFGDAIIANMDETRSPHGHARRSPSSAPATSAASWPHLVALNASSATSCCSTSIEGLPQGKALDIAQAAPIARLRRADHRHQPTTTTSPAPTSSIITAGVPRKPGMSRDDLLGINLKIITRRRRELKTHAPSAFVIVVSNPLDAMVYAVKQSDGLPEAAGGRHGRRARLGALPGLRRRGARRLGRGRAALVLGGHGDTMVPGARYCTVAGIPVDEAHSRRRARRDRRAHPERRRRDRGAAEDRLRLLSPASAAIEMAEAYLLKDKKRVLACAALLEGEYGVQGPLRRACPCVIGAGGVEKVLEIELVRRGAEGNSPPRSIT